MTRSRDDVDRRTALAASVASALLLLLVALAVRLGWTTQLDDWGVLAFRTLKDPATPVGPEWLSIAMRDWTALGGRSGQTPLAALGLGLLLALGRRRAALFLLAAVLGGWVLGPLLKALFDRPRPELAAHLVVVRSPSFPSSHATQAAASWTAAGALLARPLGGRARLVPIGLAALIVLLVGVSRPYLGVHYPSDVAAGWAAGLGWASLCAWVALRR